MVDRAVTLRSAVLKLGGPPAIINKWPDVDFPLSRLFPQPVSQSLSIGSSLSRT